MHLLWCVPRLNAVPGAPRDGACIKRSRVRAQVEPGVRCQVDVVTIAVVGVILVSYLIGTLTSSVDTERELPHRY